MSVCDCPLAADWPFLRCPRGSWHVSAALSRSVLTSGVITATIKRTNWQHKPAMIPGGLCHNDRYTTRFVFLHVRVFFPCVCFLQGQWSIRDVLRLCRAAGVSFEGGAARCCIILISRKVPMWMTNPVFFVLCDSSFLSDHLFPALSSLLSSPHALHGEKLIYCRSRRA